MTLKILHCPTTVGGNPQGLARAERALGFDSHSMTLTQNYFGYAADEVVFSHGDFSPANEMARWWAVARSLTRYDVLHYNFGQSLCPMQIYPGISRPQWQVNLYNALYASWSEFLDVRLAAKMGRVVAVTYQGNDARQADYCLKNYPVHYCHEEPDSVYNNSHSDMLKRRRIGVFERNADLIYAVNPDLLNVLPPRAKFMPYACVDPREWTPVDLSGAVPEAPHIVHAPSNRVIKGTRYILEAFERLRAEGVPFRYTLVEGMANAQARKIYETADLLIDQVLAGFYGGLSVEMMALGKPVICYMRASDMRHLPEKMRDDLPIINAEPATVYDVLKEWLTVRKPELKSRGLASRSYVETWHDPRKIAASLTDDYRRVLDRKTRREPL